MNKTHQPKGDGKPPGAIPDLPSAIQKKKHRYPDAPDCPPKDRADRLMTYLGRRDDIPPGAVGDLNRLVNDYERIINDNFSKMMELVDRLPKELSGYTVQDDKAFNRNRVGPVNEGKHVEWMPGRETIPCEAEVWAELARSRIVLDEAIVRFEKLAALLMAHDFSRGVALANQTKALRTHAEAMKLEGA